MSMGSSIAAVTAGFEKFSAAIDECNVVLARIARTYNEYFGGPPCSPLAARLRMNRCSGAFIAANTPETVLDDIAATLMKSGDHHDALTLARERIFARIDRAADTANASRQSLERGLARLPVGRNAGTNRAVRVMYLSTMHRELPAAVRRVMRGQ